MFALEEKIGSLHQGTLWRPAPAARGGVRPRQSDPELLFLDEPTTGLDPQSRRQLWEADASTTESGGGTVLMTTHYMEEAEQLCHRMSASSITASSSPLDTPSGVDRVDGWRSHRSKRRSSWGLAGMPVGARRWRGLPSVQEHSVSAEGLIT